MPIFKLTIEKTYYEQGFFNMPVAFDRFVREDEGPIDLILGSAQVVQGEVNRSANRNGTARIMGGAGLKKWFQDHFRVRDVVDVDLSSLDSIRFQLIEDPER